MSAGDRHWQKVIFQTLLLQNFSGKKLGTDGNLLAPIMCSITIGIVRNEFETMKYQTRNFKRQLYRELRRTESDRLKSVIDTFISKSIEIE